MKRYESLIMGHLHQEKYYYGTREDVYSWVDVPSARCWIAEVIICNATVSITVAVIIMIATNSHILFAPSRTLSSTALNK